MFWKLFISAFWNAFDLLKILGKPQEQLSSVNDELWRCKANRINNALSHWLKQGILLSLFHFYFQEAAIYYQQLREISIRNPLS